MAEQVYKSMSVADPNPPYMDSQQKVAAALATIGLAFMIMALFGIQLLPWSQSLIISLGAISVGVLWFSYRAYLTKSPGIKNDGIMFSSLTNRGLYAWMSGILITLFYILLYWFPEYLGLADGEDTNTGLIAMFDPLSIMLKGSPASQWFVYGSLYTLAILIFGIRFIWKYRHNRYQILRTISIMFFQFAFAFLIPEFLQKLNYPYYDMKNMWPLNYYFFDEWNIKALLSSGNLGLFMLLLGIAMIFFISPVLTYFFGKRWYCSWVCGCGGLAETVGDPFRQLSDKSVRAWKIERWMIYSVLVFSTVMTLAVIYSFFNNNPSGYWISKKLFISIMILVLLIFNLFIHSKRIKIKLDDRALRISNILSMLLFVFMIWSFFDSRSNLFFVDSYSLRSSYGFMIGAAFSGVIGVGFYPIMGSRVWCRFGCPMAAILGIQQRLFSRFRITTNGSQCISCGNCSTYCEMGIDVRSYAQRGENIVRASCVGCGICAAVCPRGVLKLENASLDVFDRSKEKA